MSNEAAVPVVTVSVNGEFITWNEGHFNSEDRDLAKRVRGIASLGLKSCKIHAMGESVVVGGHDARSATAAMMSIDPGRAAIAQGAEYVLNEHELAFAEDKATLESPRQEDIDFVE